MEDLFDLNLPSDSDDSDESGNDRPPGLRLPLGFGGLRALGKKFEAIKSTRSGIAGIYHHSRSRIFKVANKLEAGTVEDEIIKQERGSQTPLPNPEKWDFKLGDAVKVKYSLKDFESVQRRTMGWATRLVVVHGHVGVVTNVMSAYDSVINVLFPDIFQGCSLYAGVLEKVSPSQLTPYSSRWKVGDIVKPEADDSLAIALQTGLEQIPKKFMGKEGRVVAICPFHVEVTFDELQSIQINASLLVSGGDGYKSSTTRETTTISDFKIGEKVKIIQNMKTLITKQKGKGEWNKQMSKLRQREVTIVHIPDDSTFIVHAEHDRPWRITTDSVLKLDVEEIDRGKELDFVPGDLVKIRIPRKIGSLLASQNAPPVFLEYLRGIAKIEYVDDDFDCYVMFNQSQKVMVSSKYLQKASPNEIANYHRIQDLVKNLKYGDEVYLDVGPPNYVRAILRDTKFDSYVKMSLTHPAKLVGFIDYDTAVIEYAGQQKESGIRYKIALKYLTVRDKLNVKEAKTGFGLGIAKSICVTIAESIRVLYYKQNLEASVDWNVDVASLSPGCPPSLEIRIESMVAQLEDIVEWLRQNTEWKLEKFYDQQFLVTGVDGFNSEIKLSIIFNDEDSVVDKKAVTTKTAAEATNEPAPIENKTKGFASEETPVPARRRSLNPNVKSLEEFKYYSLYDSDLGRNICFPYIVIGGGRRSKQSSLEKEEQLQRARETTIAVEGNIETLNINTINQFQNNVGMSVNKKISREDRSEIENLLRI